VAPWGSVVGAMFGIAAGFVNLVQMATRLNRQEDERDRRRREGEDGGTPPGGNPS
jgi:F0F1-type ATP synthase assembly protein I